MDNINIDEVLSKHSKNVNTKISAGYSLSGKELLTVTEAKAAIKEIVEAVIDKCAEEADIIQDGYFNSDRGYEDLSLSLIHI